MYTIQTSALPVRLFDGMQYFFIAYNYDTNYIFAKPINNLKTELIITVFEFVFNKLDKKGDKPNFNATDNQCINLIKAFLQK